MPGDLTTPAPVGPLTEPHRFGVYTGRQLDGETPGRSDSVAARAGLEPPRFCGQCGRRMVVQVAPTGWVARCSRHGAVDSAELQR